MNKSHTSDGDCGGSQPPEQRPTSIPGFNVVDYARRCDESIRGSVIGAMPPLYELALRQRAPKQRFPVDRRQKMTAGFSALLNSLAETASGSASSLTIKDK